MTPNGISNIGERSQGREDAWPSKKHPENGHFGHLDRDLTFVHGGTLGGPQIWVGGELGGGRVVFLLGVTYISIINIWGLFGQHTGVFGI